MTLSEQFPNATPRPWKSGGCVVYDAPGQFVADLSSAMMSGHSREQVSANTNAIVHAVSTYDAREKALRAALSFCKSILDPMPGANNATNAAHARAFAKQAARLIEAALTEKP